MVAIDFVQITVIASGVLVLAAVGMTLVLWQEEGRRVAHHTRAQMRHTALGGGDPEPAGDRDEAELTA